MFKDPTSDAPWVQDAAKSWTEIRRPEKPIVIETRQLGALAAIAEKLAIVAPFERRGEGEVHAAIDALGELPSPLIEDITRLAMRFAELMGVAAIRIRLEGICSNACKKIHADYTDVRLITTYAGPGTEYLPFGTRQEDADLLLQLNAGDIALFKGRTFADGHAPCFHRSPPVGDTGEKRLVLVIDTPLDPLSTG